MGILDELKKVTSANQSGNNNKKTYDNLNLPVKIKSYELGGTLETNYIIGTRVDNGEEVKVYLHAIEQKESSKYKRTEIDEFADPSKRKSHVKPDCIVVFEGAIKNPDNTFKARWCVVLDREPNGTKVMVIPANLRMGEKKDQAGTVISRWFQARILNPTKPMFVESQEQFDQLLLKYLEPKFKGSIPQLNVRVKDNNGDVVVFEINPLRIDENDNGRTIKRSASALDSLNHLKTNDTEKYNILINLIENPDVTIEFIPGAIIYPGSATKEKMEDMHENTRKLLLNSFIVPEEKEGEEENNENNNKYPEIGYLFCTVASRMHEDGTPYLTYLKPLKNFDTSMSLKTISKFTLKENK